MLAISFGNWNHRVEHALQLKSKRSVRWPLHAGPLRRSRPEMVLRPPGQADGDGPGEDSSNLCQAGVEGRKELGNMFRGRARLDAR